MEYAQTAAGREFVSGIKRENERESDKREKGEK